MFMKEIWLESCRWWQLIVYLSTSWPRDLPSKISQCFQPSKETEGLGKRDFPIQDVAIFGNETTVHLVVNPSLSFKPTWQSNVARIPR